MVLLTMSDSKTAVYDRAGMTDEWGNLNIGMAETSLYQVDIQ